MTHHMPSRRLPWLALVAAFATHGVYANGQVTPDPQAPLATPISPARTTTDIQSPGTKELELSGGFIHSEGSDVGTVNADIGYGYYVAPRLNVGLRQRLSYSFIDDASDTWTASTVPFIDYSFRTRNPYFRPFVGAFAGAVYNEDDATGTIGPSLGFRYYLDENTAVVTRYRYEWFFDELSFEDASDPSDGNHVVNVGFAFSWR